MECINPVVTKWAINNAPAANTVATVSQAAAGGLRHVCTSIYALLTNGVVAAQGNATLNLRDGASGAGTLLWTMDMAIPATAGTTRVIQLSNLNIVGSGGLAMTLEFVAAAGANTFEMVNICGFDMV
jgi:hypothetical protein